MTRSRAPLVLTPQHFGSLVFDRRDSRYRPFDHETTALLRRLRAEPAEAIAAEHPEPGLFRAFYEHFDALGFFDVRGAFIGEVREIEPPEHHLLGPLAVHLEVAAACNLTCDHCFAGVLPRKAEPLSLAELDGLFAELDRLGCFRLGLTGGEPLLRAELLDILDLADRHGLHPCLTTNGLLLTERLARELGRRDFTWLNLSFDGASAASHERIRGPGTFAPTLEKARLLARHARLTLAFTIMKSNLHEIEDCARLAYEIGAHTAVFRPLYPAGVALHHLDLMPSYAEYREALERLERLEIRGVDLRGIDRFSPQSREESRAQIVTNRGCGAANQVCSISIDGQVNPCSFLGPDFEAGSIRERSFQAIWNEGQSFRRLRDEGGDDAAGFAGGCRARALSASGSVHGPDPWHEEWLAARERGRSLPLHPQSNLCREVPEAWHD